jgi:predicted GIY-YIG superfamily endonuclease
LLVRFQLGELNGTCPSGQVPFKILDWFGPGELVPSKAREFQLWMTEVWHVYIIEKSGRYYTGITTDITNRLRQHGNPQLLYKETFTDNHLAAQREKQIKSWSRAKKECLFAEFRA